MKVLFDHNMPDQLAPPLLPYPVSLTRRMGWALLMNGKLLRAAEQNGFDVLMTGDKGISRQQNNPQREISLVVVGNTDRVVLLSYAGAVLESLGRVSPGSLELVEMPGTRDFLKLQYEQGR